MTRAKKNLQKKNKRGFLEYFILTIMVLVVTVTAWTLLDNGLLDSLRDLFGGP